MIKIGIIGISEGNGHPYSFSAIFNNYNTEEMRSSDWPNIFNYLEKEPKENFGIAGAKVTHVWTQDPLQSKKIAKCSNIPHICKNHEDMLEHIDAVIIARDDWNSHYPISRVFLEAGKYVLIDKPLSLDTQECLYFENFIKSGKLISFSSLRFSPELDSLKNNLQSFGKIHLIRGITPKSWEKYGIHLLDGIAGVLHFTPSQITINKCNHESVTIQTQEGFLIELDCLGLMQYPMLQLDFFSKENHYQANCLNAFTSFKRLLSYFVQTIEGQSNIAENLYTLQLMHILQQGMK